MSFRLLSTNGELLLFASKLYQIGGGEVDPSKYIITKGGIDIDITDIDANSSTFKVGINPATTLPWANFLLGEYIDISFGDFPINANIAEIGFDNVYKLSIPFEENFYDVTLLTSTIRRELDLLKVINLDEGLYHTDTGYLIIVSDSYKTILYGSFGKIYNKRPDLRNDNFSQGGLHKWQLANMRREAYSSVMNDLQAFKGIMGENFQNLDPEPIMELIAIKTASTYEQSHERDKLLFTFEYQRKLKNYRPAYKTTTLGGELEESVGLKVRF